MSDMEKLTIESDGDITLCVKNPTTEIGVLAAGLDDPNYLMKKERDFFLQKWKEADEKITRLNEKLFEFEMFEQFAGEMDAEIDRLRAEIEKLRAALKPFAETAEWDVSGTDHDNDFFRPILTPYNRAPVLRVVHLRAAAAALKETGDE